jgi:hypothetical protein
MKRKILENSIHLQQLTLPKDVFIQSKYSSNEVLLEGKLYDLKSWSVSGDKVIINVIRDQGEEQIIKAVKDTLKTNTTQSNGLLVKLVSLIFLDYTYPSSFRNSVLYYPIQKIIPFLSEVIQSRCADILTPPPKVS